MKQIDLDRWARRKHYELFKDFDRPHFNLCAQVDVTRLYAWCKEEGLSFFQAVLYATTRVANAIPEFRTRIRGDAVVEHEVVHPSVAVLGEGELFGFCAVEYEPDFEAFLAQVGPAIEAARTRLSLEDEAGRDDYLFMTVIPWVSFTSMEHPMHYHPADSVPRIAWGKFFAEGECLRMPLCVQGHHALMDGVHAGRYFEQLQALFDDPEGLHRP
ncbi:MAG: CatA-like O-acetyltransferase [Anaerolineales bacterium]